MRINPFIISTYKKFIIFIFMAKINIFITIVSNLGIILSKER